MSFLLTSLAVTSPVVTTITHAAGMHGEGTGTDGKRDEEEKKKKEDEKRKRDEDVKRKESEERMKEIAKRVVHIEAKSKEKTAKEATEKLLKNLPVEILEMYDKSGGEIRVVNKSLAEHPDLKNRKVIDDEGNEVSLEKYNAYSLKETVPEVFIRTSEEYETSIRLRTNVYNEIGKSLVRDVLKPEVLMDAAFLNAVNQMQADEDTKAEFFTQNLKEQTDSFDKAYVKEHIKDFQHIFAKAFALHRLPEWKDFLKTYAPGMYDYFEKIDWGKLKKQIQEKEQDVKENIKQEQDVKKWAERYYKKWMGSLSSKQKESLNELKNPASEEYNINLLLKYTDGDVNRRPLDVSIESTKRYKEDIEAIDHALSNPAGKTANKIDVYTDMDVFDLNNMDEKELIDPMNPNKIDREKLRIFKTNFTYGLSNNYLIVDLHEKQDGNTSILKWHIELPAGTNTGYLGNNQLVLQRNTGLEIGEIQVIDQHGKEYIRINAKLVNKDVIDTKIQMAQSKLNQSWNSLLKLPVNTEFFKFEVNNRYASSITEGALPTIHEMMSNIPNNLVQKVTNFMLEKNGKFILTDKFIRNTPEAYYPRKPISDVLDRYDGIKGIFNEQNRTLIMSAPSTSIEGDHGMSVRTLTHEFGHAVDYYIASIIGMKERMACSDHPLFKGIFQKEGNNLTEYGKTNAQEFFADTFMMIYSNNPNERTEVLQKAPETFKFINNLIQEINSGSVAKFEKI